MAELQTSLILKLIDKLSGPAAKAKNALQGVQDTAGDLKQFIKNKRETLATAAAYETAQLKVGMLAKELAASQSPTKKLTAEFNRAKGEAGRLKTKLSLENTELRTLRASLKKSGVNTRSLSREQKRLQRDTVRLTRKIKLLAGASKVAAFAGRGLSSVGRTLAPSLNTVKFAAVGVTGAAVLMAKGFVDTSSKFEQFETTLKALTGSSDNAKKAMGWIVTFAKKTPAQLDGVMKAFIKAKALGIDPMDGSLRAMVDQTAKLGFTQEKFEGIILAVGQAWSKQKLQGEEINQLIERGVPVWNLLSKATGKSTQELSKLSQKGLLGRKTISLLLKTMGSESKGASEDASRTWVGLISNISDSWTQFQRKVGDSGMFDFLKSRLETLKKQIDEGFASGKFNAIAKDMSDAFIKVAKAVEFLFKLLYAGLKDGSIKQKFIEIKDVLVDIGKAAKVVGAIGSFFGIGGDRKGIPKKGNLAGQSGAAGFDLLQQNHVKVQLEVDDKRVKVKSIKSSNSSVAAEVLTGKNMFGAL